MNQALPSGHFALAPIARREARSFESAWQEQEDSARLRRMHSLIGLFALYTVVLLIVIALSDGADIGCVLGGIAGHVLYATHRLITSWRDAAWLENARARMTRRLRFA